ncbi:MAG: hypothetical protein ACT4PU_09380 [Planctomycetota bacterium]
MNADGGPAGADSEGGAARHWAWTAWRWLLGAALATVALVYAACWLRYLNFPYGVFGWSADHILLNAWQIAQGLPVYVDPATGPATAYLYTPGLTLLLAPLVALFGPQLWVAQALNAAGVVIIVWVVASECKRRVAAVRTAAAATLSARAPADAAARRAGWFGAGLVFLLGSASLSALLWVHPEVWAVAFSLLLLRCVTGPNASGDPHSGALPRARMALAVGLAVAAVLTKQTAVLVVGAAGLALLVRAPRAALGFGCAVAVLLTALHFLGEWLTAGQLSKYTLLGARHPFDLGALPQILGYFAEFFGPFLLVVLPLTLARVRRRGLQALADPWLTALLLLLPAQAVVLMKQAAIPNNLLGLSLVLIPLFVEGIHEWAARSRQGLPFALLAVGAALLLSFTLWRTERDVRQLATNLEHHAARLDVAQQLEQRLAAVTTADAGPAWVAHSPLFALRAGQPIETPALLLHEFAAVEPAASERLLRRIDAGDFAALILPQGFFGMVPEAVWRPRIFARYRPEQVLGGPDSAGRGAVPWGVLTPITVMVRR